MKTIILIAIIILPMVVLAQHIEPACTTFTYYSITNNSTVTTYLSPESADFRQDEFMLGWHWDATKRITEALLANQNDIYQPENNDFTNNEFIDKCDLMVKLRCQAENKNYLFFSSSLNTF